MLSEHPQPCSGGVDASWMEVWLTLAFSGWQGRQCQAKIENVTLLASATSITSSVTCSLLASLFLSLRMSLYLSSPYPAPSTSPPSNANLPNIYIDIDTGGKDDERHIIHWSIFLMNVRWLVWVNKGNEVKHPHFKWLFLPCYLLSLSLKTKARYIMLFVPFLLISSTLLLRADCLSSLWVSKSLVVLTATRRNPDVQTLHSMPHVCLKSSPQLSCRFSQRHQNKVCAHTHGDRERGTALRN